MNIAAKIVLYPVAAFAALFGLSLAGVIYEDVTYTPEQKLDLAAKRYTETESRCMDERPHSAARADCIWTAQRDNPQGYLKALADGLQAAAAAERGQEAPDASHEDLRGQKALDAARAKYYYGNTN